MDWFSLVVVVGVSESVSFEEGWEGKGWEGKGILFLLLLLLRSLRLEAARRKYDRSPSRAPYEATEYKSQTCWLRLEIAADFSTFLFGGFFFFSLYHFISTSCSALLEGIAEMAL